MPPKSEFTKEELQAKFAEVSGSTINEQASAFLRSFVAEFSGNFNEVLDLAEEFRGYAPPSDGDVHDLEEDKAHLFLEKRGEAQTVKELRDRKCAHAARSPVTRAFQTSRSSIWTRTTASP